MKQRSNMSIEGMLSSMYGRSRDQSSWLGLPDNASFQEMLVFLGLGKVDVGSFHGRKSLQTLHQLIKGRDVKFTIPLKAALPEIVGRVVLVRRSVKVTIYAGKGEECYRLREKRRTHEDGSEFVNSVYGEEPSISETRKIHEYAIDAAIRGLWEELGLHIEAEQLRQLTLTEDHAPIRESRVYPGILSLEIIERFVLELPERLWEGEYRFEDDGVTIYLEWVRANKK
jgi:hypothetical protein